MPKDMKVALVTDSSCDLPADIVEKYNLYIIPVRVITSKGEFKDRVTITSEQLYEVMKEEIPKTSLPLPEDIYQPYSSLLYFIKIKRRLQYQLFGGTRVSRRKPGFYN